MSLEIQNILAAIEQAAKAAQSSVPPSHLTKVFKSVNLVNVPLQVWTGSCEVVGWHLFNSDNKDHFVKFFNKDTSPILGVDIPVMTLGVKAGDKDDESISLTLDAFPLGLWIACTTKNLDTDNTAPNANTQIANVFYIIP